MNYCYELNMLEQVPLLYINYRKMKEFSPEKRKNIFKKEIVYLFFEENALKSFYKENQVTINRFTALVKPVFSSILNIIHPILYGPDATINFSGK